MPSMPAGAHGADALFDAVCDRLKAMAGRQLGKRERDTLDTTALVHELYLRCKAQDELNFRIRRSSTPMRRVRFGIY